MWQALVSLSHKRVLCRQRVFDLWYTNVCTLTMSCEQKKTISSYLSDDADLVQRFIQSKGTNLTKDQQLELTTCHPIIQGLVGLQGAMTDHQKRGHRNQLRAKHLGHVYDFAEFVYAHSTNPKQTSIKWFCGAILQGDNMSIDSLFYCWCFDKKYIHYKNCFLCRKNPGSWVVVPCMHMCVCSHCARSQLTHCPKCGKPSSQISPVFT